MNKRAFLEGFFAASTMLFGGNFIWQRIAGPQPRGFHFTPVEIATSTGVQPLPAPAPAVQIETAFDIRQMSEQEISSYLTRIRNFDAIFANDIYLDVGYEKTLLKTTQRLARLERHIGHGNFNIISFDEMLKYGNDFPEVGRFDQDELEFIDEVFFTDPTRYGFFGQKVTSNLTDSISRNDIAKIPYSGHFLLKGESLNLYNRLKRDVGDQIVLTSGVRSVVKQMRLFLAKTVEANGNLSRASRSLAPPGHSYHGVGDFDVGKIGLGEKNFTADFSGTSEYQKIAGLAYVNIRYPTDNLFGVRFEPWHIKIST
ncbi:MAG: M15 family metallopeptidase [Pseudohongiellaceae bacterium]